MVAHLLMTRFAVDFGRTANPMPLTKTWFRRRFDLFEQYCLPSVLAQTFRDFRWLIYIAPKCESEIAPRLRAYDPRIDVRTDDHKGALNLPADVLVTTRLDSDDAIGATVLEQVDRLAPTVRRATLVEFPKGYHVHHGRQRAYVGKGGAFKALIEPNVPRVGVYVKNCDVIGAHFPAIRIDSPSWLRVVHGGNLVNQFNNGIQSYPLASVRDPEFPWLD